MARADTAGLFWDDTPPPKPPKKEKDKRSPPERTWERPDYLPNYEEALAFNIEVMNDMALYQAMLNQERLVFDVECYKNYFLVAFMSIVTKKVWFCEFDKFGVLDTGRLTWVLQNFLTIGFNTLDYDLPIIALALANRGTEALKYATNQIINEGMQGREVLKLNKIKALKKEDGKKLNHIDLIEVAPLQASLKIYGGRLHTKRMQDLPFDAETYLSPEQIVCTRWYCLNDLTVTAELYAKLDEQIKLRERMSGEYQLDLRSKSDAQVAETVIASEIRALNGGRYPEKPTIIPGTWYRYQTPIFMQFYTPTMQWVLQTVQNAFFIVGENGSVGMPPELANMEIPIGNSRYTMGIGGLHSTEKSICHFADANHILVDRDVTSYYPFIILLLKLFPKHLGQDFLRVYEQIVNKRLSAKKRASAIKKLIEDTIDKVEDPLLAAELKEVSTAQDSLKITINGSFGKLGSKYSILYAPDLLIQVTVTGQLSLLMLIERLELCGISIVSANTDGIVIKCPKHLIPTMDAVVAEWEQQTGFGTEDTQYLGLFSRDVNNYIAVKRKQDKKTKEWLFQPDGCKTKGTFGKPGLQKNPQNDICSEAVTEFLSKGIPLEKTIRDCKTITKFVTVRAVKGGAVKVYDSSPIPEHNTKEELVALAGFFKTEGNDLQGGDLYRHPEYGENLAVFDLQSAYKMSEKMLTYWKENQYLGKAVRWYYAVNITGAILYAKSGNQVPRSEGAKPCMDLPDQFPIDIDYDWYIREANDMLKDVGYG